MRWRAQYESEVATWNVWAIVLTVPNVKGERLRETMRAMIRASREIANDIRRTDGLAWRAIRKLECTYSRSRRDFHPHFHLVVDGEAPARALLKRWLERFPAASPLGQFIEAKETAIALREIFKYAAKAVSTVRTKAEDGSDRVIREGIPAPALDAIFVAMRGLRTYQPMGFKASAPDDEDPESRLRDDGSLPAAVASPDGDVSTWEWDDRALTWIHFGHWTELTGALPARYLRMLERVEAEIWEGVAEPEAHPGRLVSKCYQMLAL